MQNNNNSQAIPTSEESTNIASSLIQLEQLGFSNSKKNFKLLTKTNGNFEVVKNFLHAHNKLKEIVKNNKPIKKIQKKEHKIAKKTEKSSFKIEKKLSRELKKTQKKERKLANEDFKHIEFDLPKNITTAHLDGNNMLFVLKSLRDRAIRRKSGGKVQEAERILEQMARQWLEQTPTIQNCLLIFDQTNTFVQENRLTVRSARPNFPTSDHALIEFAKNASVKDDIAVFTSDRQLREELTKAGVQVFPPKMWFHLASRAIQGNQTIENLDNWADTWMIDNFAKIVIN